MAIRTMGPSGQYETGLDAAGTALPELLAPAGGLDQMLAAIAAGADAIYAGLGGFNARVSAHGFTDDEFARGCAVAHAHGVRVYVTLNVFVFDDELSDAVAPKLTDAFDPTMYARVSDETRALDELADSLSEADSGGRLKLASQKFYFAGLVACIENLCLSPHGVSSIERSARMRDMLEAPRTRQMVAALKDNHRGLGLLFGPIASAKPARCVMCTHLSLIHI